MVKNTDDNTKTIKISDKGTAKVLKPVSEITVIESGMNPATDNEKTNKKITKGLYPAGF